jgi:hypothetical protein
VTIGMGNRVWSTGYDSSYYFLSNLSSPNACLGMSDNPDVPNDEDLNDPPPNQASNLEDGDNLTIDHGPTILQAHTQLT